MSPLDVAVIRRKMQIIALNLRQLEGIRNIGFERYRESVLERKAAERMLQELIEAAIDINLHVLAAKQREIPEENYESFVRLGSSGVLSVELARSLAPSAGLRNRLVHEYDAIDDRKVWDALEDAQNLFPRYLKSIEDLLETDAS